MTADIPSLILGIAMLAIPASALIASYLERRKDTRRTAPFGKAEF